MGTSKGEDRSVSGDQGLLEETEEIIRVDLSEDQMEWLTAGHRDGIAIQRDFTSDVRDQRVLFRSNTNGMCEDQRRESQARLDYFTDLVCSADKGKQREPGEHWHVYEIAQERPDLPGAQRQNHSPVVVSAVHFPFPPQLN